MLFCFCHSCQFVGKRLICAVFRDNSCHLHKARLASCHSGIWKRNTSIFVICCSLKKNTQKQADYGSWWDMDAGFWSMRKENIPRSKLSGLKDVDMMFHPGSAVWKQCFSLLGKTLLRTRGFFVSTWTGPPLCPVPLRRSRAIVNLKQGEIHAVAIAKSPSGAG